MKLKTPSAAFISTKAHLPRRSFLKAAGATLALPWLDAMLPAFATRAQVAAATEAPMRFVAMQYHLGFHAPNLFPEQVGRDYQPTPYLEPLQPYRDDFTLISGLSHAEQNGANGHSSEVTWLTAARRPQLPGFRNSVSIDEVIREQLNPDTRFPSLTLNVSGRNSLSYTANGVNVPAIDSPAQLFEKLFIDGTPEEVEAQMTELERGRSVLDAVAERGRRLQRRLGARDREKFDQYLTSVREMEVQLLQNESWVKRPKPGVDREPPTDVEDRHDILARTKLMHDMIVLALQTDSTRIITYSAGGGNFIPVIEDVNTDWHDLSHHGQDDMKIDELAIIEQAEFNELARLFKLLKDAGDATGPLMDRTQLLIGSNLGNASAHTWWDLPIMVAGGGLRHGQHLAVGGQAHDNGRLSNLFVQLAQRMGVEIEQFGSSDKSAVPGLG